MNHISHSLVHLCLWNVSSILSSHLYFFFTGRFLYSTRYLRLYTFNWDGTLPLDSCNWEDSFEPLNVPFILFQRSLLYTVTLGRNFERLTLSYVYLDYKYVIAKWIYGLDSHYWEWSSKLLNILFALFSRFLFYTFTIRWNFEPFSISYTYSGYRHAIAK